MPSLFHEIATGANVPHTINAIVEIPKGRRSKFEVDKETGLLKLDRYLYSSLMYPGDYGFIPRTLAEDGDPLDILVMVNEPTFSGCLIEARPIGLFKMTDKGDNDFKVLAVPNTDPIFKEYNDLWRIPPHFLREVEHFFGTYKALEGANLVQTQGWESADKARMEILACVQRFNDAASAKAAATAAKADDPVLHEINGLGHPSGKTKPKKKSKK
jgi:inorganic pyrophosphatase